MKHVDELTTITIKNLAQIHNRIQISVRFLKNLTDSTLTHLMHIVVIS